MAKRRTETHKFKKGEKLGLDNIYGIQGLCEGNWWEFVGSALEEKVIITRDITIQISWWE